MCWWWPGPPCSGAAEKWLDAECISEIEPTGFAEHLLIGEFERTR